MANIGNITTNTLKLELAKKPLIFIPTITDIRIRSQCGRVLFKAGTRVIDFDTITAHRIGLEIHRAIPKMAPDEMFVLKVNGEPIELPKEFASKVAVGLLRKADDADDWQLTHRRKLQ